MQDQSDDKVIVGRVTGLYGIKGWVKVFSYTQPRDNITHYSPWLLRCGDADWQAIEVAQGKAHGKGVVVRLASCQDRDQASQLIGCDIALLREQLPQLDDSEYYWHDLVGLQVVTEAGTDLGVVDHLIETGANDVLVVHGERERLIPYIREQVIKQVDLQTRTIRVDWDPEF